MRLRPMPVVMVSTLTERGAETTIRALELGAIDFVAKPKIGTAAGLQELGRDICEKIRVASRAHASACRRIGRGSAGAKAGVAAVQAALDREADCDRASTGGTDAIREVLVRLRADSPAVLITQRRPPGFTRSFAARLNTLCRLTGSEAADGERVLPGHAYVAPGDRHMRLAGSGANYVIELDDGLPVNQHRPSVEVLFKSVAQVAGPNSLGATLTGMGKDGASAMLEMKRAGSYNIAQDEATCAVFGMQKEAIACGGVEEVLAVTRIAGRIEEKLDAAGGTVHRV